MNFSQRRSASHIPRKHLVSWLQCVLVLLTAVFSTLALAVNPVVTVSSTENPTPSGKGSAFIIAQVRGDIAGSPLPSERRVMTTRRAPAASTSSRLPALIPPMANQGLPLTSATGARSAASLT